MTWKPEGLDYNLSPYTGLTKQSWIGAADYLLEGIFSNIKDFHDPVIMPRQDMEITYPHMNAPTQIREAEYRAEIFEGLARTLFIAAPVIHIQPELKINGYVVRDYYKAQILRSCTKGDSVYVGSYEDLQELTGHKEPERAFQQTVETCALVICLWMCKDEIWNTYTKAEKDTIAEFLSSYAHANTVPQNWRLFNMLDMAFLHREGYEVDQEIMLDHAQTILHYYAGDGWYRDGESFDYYSVWAFNVYAPLWNRWYGYEKEPYIAKKFEEYSNKLMETLPDFFDRDGFVNMWGRSNIYRNAVTSAFDGNLFLSDWAVKPGLARRIASGALLQFFTRDDFLYKGVPTLGFYGQFSPLVQGYSCAESPFWLGKAFLCLYLPDEHPFWMEKESNGTWEQIKGEEVKETSLDGPGLCFSNHAANGETVLRTGKITKAKNDYHGMWNYSKLSFNTKYPWEAAPIFQQENDFIKPYEMESQQYVLKDERSDETERANVTLWHGLRSGCLYRRQFFNYTVEAEQHCLQGINLVDFTVPYGIIRVDKLRLFHRPVSLTLGSYGFPDNGTEIIFRKKGFHKAIILKGKDHCGREHQMAMTIFDGWDDISYVKSKGSNPDSMDSIIIFAKTTRMKQYGGYEPYILISQVITKESLEDFKDDELFPIEQVVYEDSARSGAYGTITVVLKNGTKKMINYEGIEGRLML